MNIFRITHALSLNSMMKKVTKCDLTKANKLFFNNRIFKIIYYSKSEIFKVQL